MISSFDLILLGSLVSAGGLAFLFLAKWPHLGPTWFNGRRPDHQSPSARDYDKQLEHSVTTTGARWLTVGALTLLLAYSHGAEEGYLFGPWSDVLFHIIFFSSCWAATAFRIRRAAGQPTSRTNESPIPDVSFSDINPSRTGS